MYLKSENVSRDITRFSSSVRVTSVHVRASSVLSLVVHSSEGLLGSAHADSKEVTLPANGQHKWSREEVSERDIDVDVRGVKRCAVSYC